MPVVAIDGITPAQINFEGIVPTDIVGHKIIVIDLYPAEINAEGIPASEITGASVTLVLDSPAEIEITSGSVFAIGAEITVSSAEINIEGIVPDLAHGVTVSPALIQAEGIPAVNITGSGVEFVINPAEINIEGIVSSVFYFEYYMIQFNPAEINIEGIVSSIAYNVDVPPAEINIEGIAPSVFYNVDVPPAEINIEGVQADGITSFVIDFSRTLTLFKFFITGVDDFSDIEIPISSFQVMLYANKKAYLQVVIPGIKYADEITNRSNGNLSLYITYTAIDTFEILQQELIIAVQMDTVRVDYGTDSQSITLSGYESDSQAANRQTSSKVITIDESWYNYKRTDDNITIRLVKPHIYLQAGDTVQDGETEITVNRIIWQKSENFQHMEITG